MRTILVAALMLGASGTCNPPVANPPPGPIDIPDSGDDAAPEPTPDTNCEVAWTVMVDAECSPPEGHSAWLSACSKLSSDAVGCVMTVESCAAMRACLETP